jgi:hypothetical protein
MKFLYSKQIPPSTSICGNFTREKICCFVDMDANWFNDLFDNEYDNIMNNVV